MTYAPAVCTLRDVVYWSSYAAVPAAWSSGAYRDDCAFILGCYNVLAVALVVKHICPARNVVDTQRHGVTALIVTAAAVLHHQAQQLAEDLASPVPKMVALMTEACLVPPPWPLGWVSLAVRICTLLQ